MAKKPKAAQAAATISTGTAAVAAPPTPPAAADAGGDQSAGAAAAAATDTPAAAGPQGAISSDAPRGGSGTAREAPGTGGGTTAETPGVGLQAAPQNEPAPEILSAWQALLDLGEEEAGRRFPRIRAAITTWSQGAGSVAAIEAGPTVRITARLAGFRRAGIAHPKGPADHPAARFTPEQLEQLLGEPNLTVELV